MVETAATSRLHSIIPVSRNGKHKRRQEIGDSPLPSKKEKQIFSFPTLGFHSRHSQIPRGDRPYFRNSWHLSAPHPPCQRPPTAPMSSLKKLSGSKSTYQKLVDREPLKSTATKTLTSRYCLLSYRVAFYAISAIYLITVAVLLSASSFIRPDRGVLKLGIIESMSYISCWIVVLNCIDSPSWPSCRLRTCPRIRDFQETKSA